MKQDSKLAVELGLPTAHALYNYARFKTDLTFEILIWQQKLHRPALSEALCYNATHVLV